LDQMYRRHKNCVPRIRWNSKVMRHKWKVVTVHFEIVLILTQDRCTVCAKHLIGLEIILDAPDITPR